MHLVNMGNKVSSTLHNEEIKLIREETCFSAAQIERLYSRFTSLDKSGICGSLSREDFLRIPELAINPLCDRIVHMFFVDCDEDHDRINFRQFMKVLATFRSSSKPVRSRSVSRQECIENVWDSLIQGHHRHSRNSSCDGLFNYQPIQHYTTNQHNIHYVPSATNLSSSRHIFSHNISRSNNCGSFMSNSGYFKKPYDPLNRIVIDDEPVNSEKQKLYFMFKVYDVDNDNLIGLEDLRSTLKLMVGSYISEFKISELAEKTFKQVDKNCSGYIEFDEFCAAFLRNNDEDKEASGKASIHVLDSINNANTTKFPHSLFDLIYF